MHAAVTATNSVIGLPMLLTTSRACTALVEWCTQLLRRLAMLPSSSVNGPFAKTWNRSVANGTATSTMAIAKRVSRSP